ncbi:hypothetical protein LTS17_002131 [Exophiala oligosperma]
MAKAEHPCLGATEQGFAMWTPSWASGRGSAHVNGANHGMMNSRLARRGGIRRISSTIYDDARMALKAHLREILRRVVILMGGPDNELRHGVNVPQRKVRLLG